jgi:Tfp pilus assembly protein PilV
MQKVSSHIKNKNKGFSIAEILVAVAVFLIFVSATVGIIVSSDKQLQNGGHKERATALAEEGVEAVRNLRDADFNNLTDGTFGLNVSSGVWSLVGTPDVTNIFTRTVVISTVNLNEKKVDVTVTWSDQISPSNSLTTTTYLTKWQAMLNIGPGLTVNKVVINHGLSKVATNFGPFFVTSSGPTPIATQVTLGVATLFADGTYTVSESTPDSNYTQTFSGDCDSSGQVVMLANAAKTCTITNEEKLSYLIVNKTVINHGGSKVAADFAPYKIDGTTTVTLGASTAVNSGVHTISETTNVNYTQTFSGDCNSGGSVTVSTSSTKTCTITNEEQIINVIPTVTSPTSASIATTTATLGANVTSLGIPASISARGTCWGTTPAPTTNCVAEGGTTTGVFTQARTGFSPGTTYYYRGYATNATGTAYSPDGTFTTANICDTNFYNDKFNVCYFAGMTAPTGAVQALSQFTETTVASPIGIWAGFNHNWLTGVVDSSGLSDLVSAVWRGNINFQAGSYIFHTSSDDGIQLTVTGFGNVIDNFTDHGVIQNDSVATVLPAGYRNVQLRWYENGGDAVSGLWWDYTPLSVPVLTTPTSASVGVTIATLGANVTSLGIPASISARGTCFGTTPAPTTNCVAEGGTTTGVFTQARTGFSPGTTYYYRGYATNATGTAYSPDGTFTTVAACSVAASLVGTPTLYDGNNVTSALVNKPTGVTTGDIMFAYIMHFNGTDRLSSIPAGWNPIGRNKNGNYNQALYYKVAAAGEAANYTFGLSAGSRLAVTISAYRGCFDTVTPIDTYSNVPYTTNNTTYEAGTMTLSNPNTTVLMFPSTYDNSVRTFANPLTQSGGWTEDYDHGSTTSRFSRAGYRKYISASGLTGVIDSIGTLSGTTIKHAFGVSLKPPL